MHRPRPLVLGSLLVSLSACGIGCAASTTKSGLGAPAVPGADPQRGQHAIERYGCGACHDIPGVPGARGLVGPPLGTIGKRSIIAGRLANTPDNLIRWIEDPQLIDPGNAMPNLGVSTSDARDIAAYLYTLH